MNWLRFIEDNQIDPVHGHLEAFPLIDRSLGLFVTVLMSFSLKPMVWKFYVELRKL